MSYPDGAFDCIAVPYVLSVTPNPGRLIAEIRRVCRKGGTILILNPFSGSRCWRPLEGVLGALAEKIGFRTDRRCQPRSRHSVAQAVGAPSENISIDLLESVDHGRWVVLSDPSPGSACGASELGIVPDSG